MPVYVETFLKNGRNTRDQKLLDLEQQMGGTPTKNLGKTASIGARSTRCFF